MADIGYTLSPEFDAIAKWAMDNGVISQYRLNPRLRGATYSHDDKIVTLGNGSTDTEGMHEILHGLLRSNLPSNTKSMEDSFNSLGFTDKILDPVVLPKHWKTSGADNPMVFDKGQIKTVNSPILSAAKLGRRNLVSDVVGSIPKGERWSNLTKNSQFLSGSQVREALTYGLTDPDVTANTTGLEQPKKLGMYLLDRGVPMNLVYPYVQRLMKQMGD